ncbi:MAG: type VI secretion protein IcmF/TssM N-terminal domain-containing protein [Acidobacteriota bacterium]|nr:type VI secretion protein IcmF/TssM N-terminal domain-containing protein [Acidobacteriota bacterium]
MNQLLSLLMRIPGVARYLMLLILVGLAFYVVYREYGLVAAIVVLLMVGLIWLGVWLFQRAEKRKQRNEGLKFGKALDEQAGPSKKEVNEKVAELNKKWREAMTNLKSSNIDIYTLPWYMLIGEPQSGKSTTLKSSGLKFPVGMESISGGGGTRNCDWWFAEQGVILDTAGRLTFHDRARPDSAEWDRFLDLLGRHRPYCPINGVILVIPIDALLNIEPEDLEGRANNISKQLHHIQQKLAIQFPVYLMVTKCDRIYGFVEFFNKLTPDQQREMLGWSSQIEDSAFDPETFEHSFNELVRRMEAIRLESLSKGQYVEAPGKTFTFTHEFRGLCQPLLRYLSIIFQNTVYKDRLFFRGYYFCSGMLDGEPIVAACRNMLPSTAHLQKLEEIFNKERSFFVRDFYTDKVFPEEGLVRRASHFEKNDKLKRRLVWAFNIALLLFGLLFLWGLNRDLRSSLTRPMQAIDNTLTGLDSSQGTFFSSDDDRRTVYANLRGLRNELDADPDGGFFAMFRGDRNAMTEPLDDTFAYLYLDRFLLDLFQQTQAQLRGFRISNPARPRNSTQELTFLLDALAELKRWQVAVHDKETADFDPTIAPFLNLSIDPLWNNDLADMKGDTPIEAELEIWFQKVYDRSSKDTKEFLITEMVRRSTGLYTNLHAAVVEFYKNQPELLNYEDKRRLLADLESAYRNVGRDSPTWQEHDGKMTTLAGFFSDDNRRIIESGDRYLPFDEVRNRTIDALGPEFKDMRLTEEERGLLVNRPRNPGALRNKLPAGVPFVNQLKAVSTAGLPDPRGLRPPGEGNESLGYPPLPEDFWTRVLKPYTEQFDTQADPYAALPNSDSGLDENLDVLFNTGRRRVTRLKQILQQDMEDHMTFAEGTSDSKVNTNRFRNSMYQFSDNLMVRERNMLGAALARIAAGESMDIPAPPTRWKAYMDAFNRRSQSGRNYGGFTEGPDRISRKLRDNYQLPVRDIFADTAKPYEVISSYVDKVHGNLADFYDVLLQLDAVSDEELAKNKSRYRNRIPGRNKLQRLAEIENVPSYLRNHRTSLDRWSDAALDAFRRRVDVSDPCPECPRQLTRLRQAVSKAGEGFPMKFYASADPVREGLGKMRFDVPLADPDHVDEVLQALEVYRNPTKLQESYLRQKGLTQIVTAAQDWAAGVRRLRSKTQQYRFVLRHVDSDTEKGLNDLFTIAELQGAWKSERELSVVSPRMTKIIKNPDAVGEEIQLFFTDRDSTNKHEARLVFPRGLNAFLAFVLGGTQDSPSRVSRFLSIRSDVGNTKVVGNITLETTDDSPVPTPPPDWKKLGI